MDFTEWISFEIGEVFDSISKYGDVENVRVLESGNTNYVSTSKYNNGLYRKVKNKGYKLEEGNCITIGIDGSFSVFYQPYSFIRTTNIAVLRSNKLNKYNALFLITVIRKAISMHYYGVKLKSDDMLATTQLLLPAINGSLNWEYMSDYIENIYSVFLRKYTTNIGKSRIELNFSNWKSVKLIKVFEHQRGQRYIKELQKAGPYPYISSSEVNNGVDGYVTPSPRSIVYHDALTIANSGSRGVTFYHEGNFVASDHVTVLWTKSGKRLTKKIGLFLKPIIEKNKNRYLFNKEINEDTIKEIDIFIPYKDTEPDWDYMETFIDSLPNSDLI